MNRMNFIKPAIPETTLRRLLYYMRCLRTYKKDGVKTVLSDNIAKKCGVKSSVVRKDLSYFGEFGVRGKGYDVDELCHKLDTMLNSLGPINTIVIGAGKLGTAIINHSKENFKTNIIAAFDKNRDKTGKNINGVPVYSLDKLEDIIKENNIKIAVIAIPPCEVQPVVDRLVSAGIKSILSLALLPINVPEGVEVSFFDVLSEVEYLFLKLNFKES